jgi:dodecin
MAVVNGSSQHLRLSSNVVPLGAHSPAQIGAILTFSIIAVMQGGRMSVAKVSEISATSTKSFEDAIQQGLTRASKTLRNIRGAWIKEQHVRCDNGRITEYQVNMMVTFVLDD